MRKTTKRPLIGLDWQQIKAVLLPNTIWVLMYAEGEGVAQDHTEAVKWYQKVADQGVAAAQNKLGVMYENGKGVAKDTVLAYMWFNIGAANGDEMGAKNRDLIVKQMTSQEIEKAKAMARACMDSNYQNCGN